MATKQLTGMQLACIRAVARLSINYERVATADVGNALPDSLVRHYMLQRKPQRSEQITDRLRDSLIANHLGPLLTALAKAGYLVRTPNPHPTGGNVSWWRLGPLSDKLREDGILK